MKLNTDILFTFLLKTIKPCMVMDIGSRDGLNSVVFRKILTQAEIVAFEASPDN